MQRKSNLLIWISTKVTKEIVMCYITHRWNTRLFRERHEVSSLNPADKLLMIRPQLLLYAVFSFLRVICQQMGNKISRRCVRSPARTTFESADLICTVISRWIWPELDQFWFLCASWLYLRTHEGLMGLICRAPNCCCQATLLTSLRNLSKHGWEQIKKFVPWQRYVAQHSKWQ